MRLSDRITGLNAGGGDGWEVFYRARQMAEAGAPVIELTIGEHDIGTARPVLDAMYAAAIAGVTGYADVPGIPDLRREIADRTSARTGVPTRPENVIVTAGGQAALLAAHTAACDPGDTALYLEPGYVTYPGTLRAIGARPHALPLRPETGFKPTAADLEPAPEARSLLINTPNNPTGGVYGRGTLDEIADFVARRGLWLISDEVYETQVWDGAHLSPRALPGMADRTLVVGSMSKGHAMTGSRIGWIIGPEEAIDAMTSLSLATTYGVPGFIQKAALYALREGAAFEAAIAAPFRARRAVLQDVLSGQSLIRLIPPEGAMYAMLDIRATGLSGVDFAECLLDQEKIAVMPGESFGAAAAGHLRLALTRPEDELADALTRMIAFAKEMTT